MTSATMPASFSGDDYACPYCDMPQGSKSARWRHTSICPENPDPTCRWCGLHYRASALPKHEDRCNLRPHGEAPRPPLAPPMTPRPEASAGKLGLARAVPKPRPETVPAHAATSPKAKPSPDEGKPTVPANASTARRHRSKAAQRAALLKISAQPAPEPPAFLPLDPALASLALNAEELTRGLLPAPPRKLAKPREPRPIVPPASGAVAGAAGAMSESGALVDLAGGLRYLHDKGLVHDAEPGGSGDPWERFLDNAEERLSPEHMDELMEETSDWHPLAKTIIGVTCRPPPEAARREDPLGYVVMGAAIAGLIWLLMRLLAPAKEESATDAAASAPPSAPAYRPPYNPALWASIEHYKAEVGHLPPPPRGPDQAPEIVVGLDRRGAGIQASADADFSRPFTGPRDEQAAQATTERKRRGG